MANPKEYTDKIPILGWFINQVQTFSDDYGWFVAGICVLLFVAVLRYTTVPPEQVLSIVIATVPIWLTWFIFVNFFDKWGEQVGKKFYIKNGRTTLRIKLPQEVLKSPEAMEFVIAQIHNVASPDNLMQTYLDGKRPLTYAFEIVSIGGDVRFTQTCQPQKQSPLLRRRCIVNILEWRLLKNRLTTLLKLKLMV